MKKNIDIILILAMSVIISITGFIVDLDERVPDIITNFFEIMMMTGIVFGILLVFYIPAKFIFRRFREHTA